jgi:hypothetical protein
VHVADRGKDSRLTGHDPDRRGEEEEGKRTRSTVSANTTTKSSDVEAIDIEHDEGESPKATTAPSPGRQAAETPRPALEAQGRSTSSTSLADDVWSNKRLKKAPPKPCKSNLRSATK